MSQQQPPRNASAAKNTPQPSASPTHGENSRRSVAMTPTRFNRIQEKHVMQDLNNRLAAYIDRVKFLEKENLQLTQELRAAKDAAAQELSNLKALFESELDDLRQALDREAKRKNRLELDVKRNCLEAAELIKTLENTTEDFNKAFPYIAQFNELNSKHSQTLIDNTNLKDANKKLATELTIEKKNMKDAKKILEEETLKRIAAENRLQSLKEDFKFKEEVHNQLLNDARSSRRTEIIGEVDGRLTKEYEDKLQNELQVLRQQAKEDAIQNKQDISELFNSKVKNVENELERKKRSVESTQEDLNTANTRIRELTLRVNDLLASRNTYLANITELEQIRENQRIKYQSDTEDLERQLKVMQDDMSQKVQEYQDLMDIKVALDIEIGAYRKLLESEEKRLSITPNTSVVSSPRGKKRKWFQSDEPENKFSDVITTSSTGDIEICEVCPDGQFIRLYNKGFERVALGGFELVRTTDVQNNSTEFKLDPSVTLEAGHFITVWSSPDSDQILELSAGSIVMNNQAWVVGDLMATQLLNTEGQEIATHELKKEKAFHSLANFDFDENEDNSTGDKCSLM